MAGRNSASGRVRYARSGERFVAHGLTCALGEVLDLSATGLRARTGGRPPMTVGASCAVVVTSEGQQVRVTGTVVWVRRVGRGPLAFLGPAVHEVGVRFVDVRPGVAAALVQLAKHGFISAGVAVPAAAAAAPAAVRARLEVEDLYEVLGVAREAEDEAIHTAYRRLAFRLHPDRNPSPEDAARFVLVSKSYSVLRDAVKRRRYDDLLRGAA